MNTKMNGIFPSTPRKLSNVLLAADNIDALRRKMLTAVLKIIFDERNPTAESAARFLSITAGIILNTRKTEEKKKYFTPALNIVSPPSYPKKARAPRV